MSDLVAERAKIVEKARVNPEGLTRTERIVARSAGVNIQPINPEPVEIDYTNYRGEFGVRRILPLTIRFDEVEWHPGPQWLLEAIDLDKNAQRTFAIKDISAWRPILSDAPRTTSGSGAEGEVATSGPYTACPACSGAGCDRCMSEEAMGGR